MKKYNTTYYLILFFFSCFRLFSQPDSDSLISIFNNSKEIDETRLNRISKQLILVDSIKLAELADKIITLENKASLYHQIGKGFYDLDNYEKARIYYSKALDAAKQTNNKKLIAKELSAAGNIYRIQDMNTTALNLFFQSTVLYRELNDSKEIAYNLGMIGDINRCINQPNAALRYLNESLTLSKQNNDLKQESFCYSSMGAIYQDQKKYKQAAKNYEKGLEIALSIKDSVRITDFLYSTGDLLVAQGKAEEAVYYFYRSLQYSEANGDNFNRAMCNIGLAKAALKRKEYDKTIEYGLTAYEIGRSISTPGICMEASDILYKVYHAAKDYKNAFQYLKISKELRDSTTNRNLVKQQAQIEFNFINQLKIKQDSILRAERQHQYDLIQAAEAKQQGIIVIASIIAIIIAFIIIIVIFRSYQKEKNSKQIISQQKLLVEEKNKEILDSINYAKRIQQAFIPTTEELDNLFPEHFTLLLPKAIVSGDFYWTTSKPNYKFIAVADCTGHGVPGGFMSMMGATLLNEIVNEKGIHEPADILDLLKFKIIMALKQSENVNEAKDGMDIVLCRIDRTSNELVFSGANNSAYIVRNNKLIELKGNKQPIGISHFNDAQQFMQQTIPLQENDCLYMFTDGYADQFGGETGKKFKSRKLEELILAIHHKSMSEQIKILEQAHYDWRGNAEQLDDICIFGTKI